MPFAQLFPSPADMKHLLKLESLPRADFDEILRDTAVFKRERGRHSQQPLAGQTWALMFSKQSTRTRLSFEVGIRELGGMPMFLSALDIQLGRGEPIKDTARVMGRMVHGAVIRTFAQQDVEEFAKYSGIPTLNALTDDEHPCQILADIFTFQERRGSIEGKTVAFIGDGACNVANSWIWAAAKFNFALRIAAPKKFQPAASLLRRAGGNISVTEDIQAAARGADFDPARSDVDLLIDLEPGRSLFDLARLQRKLEELLTVRVDVVSSRGLRDQVRETVLRDALPL